MEFFVRGGGIPFGSKIDLLNLRPELSGMGVKIQTNLRWGINSTSIDNFSGVVLVFNWPRVMISFTFSM